MSTRCKGPAWLDHTQHAQTYGLGHLHPTIEKHTFPARPAPRGRQGDPAVEFQIYIHYSHHCFTISLDSVGSYDAEEIYEDEGRGEKRAFDKERWQLSQTLPGIIKQLLDKKAYCYQTKHTNFVVVDAGVATPDYYRIYFKAKNWAGGASLFIESAYPTKDNPVAPGTGHIHKSINAILAEAMK